MKRLSRRNFLNLSMSGIAGSIVFNPLTKLFPAVISNERKMNVLFIAVDDLRPQLGCYGASMIKSPNIDSLAESGTQFNRAYCQQAICSPSRTSLMTGRRPDTTMVYDLATHFRDTIPDVVTLPQQFIAHGYYARSMGKVYHRGFDDRLSWSVYPSFWPSRPYPNAYITENVNLLKQLKTEGIEVTGIPWEAPDIPDSLPPDGKTTNLAIETLNNFAQPSWQDKPFFLAVGFSKPHLPFIAPKKYWDLYDRNKLELADNPFAPQDAPQEALNSWGELRGYYGMPKQGPVSDEQALSLIHGYYACVSYIDTLIGRVISELERLGLRENTIIILWGDHGWQLGEHGLWCKHTNFETSVLSPLIISVPGQQSAGTKTDALVEFVDIYPSLCELCGIPLPDGLEGSSFRPLIENPNREWKKAAFSQYPRRINGQKGGMGYSIRTDHYRYTEWTLPGTSYLSRELYDHYVDPKENVNIAYRPENAMLVTQLSNQLHEGWRKENPVSKIYLSDNIPDEFILFQNYPNPFNQGTVIKYSLPNREYITLEIFNLLGQHLKTLVSRAQDRGEYSVYWDGTNSYSAPAASGTYIYQLKTEHLTLIKKLVLVK